MNLLMKGGGGGGGTCPECPPPGSAAATDVAISSDNGKDVGGSARKICGIEIDIGFIDKPGFVIKRPIFGSS